MDSRLREASKHAAVPRRFRVGAECSPGGVHFRVWAPRPNDVRLIVFEGEDRRAVSMTADEEGYRSVFLPDCAPGTRYAYELDGGERLFADPASRYQPDGPHGPSEVIDPHLFEWSDQSWRGISMPGQVLYEMHIGTFTKTGSFTDAIEELPAIADLGVTVLEIMPVADFTGRFGWGYDGVNLWAPTHLYGRPDAFRAFVDRAHALGLAVILDVVYNHFGPDGNYLPQFSDHYLSKEIETDWGAAVNFASPEVREYFRSNVAYWIEEFHLDGLRIDATQDIYDDAEPHILTELTQTAHSAAQGKKVIVIAENEPQSADLVRSRRDGGHGMDAMWNDDFHHSASVALNGRREAYYTDYKGSPQEFVSCYKYGFLYQGQHYEWQKQRRGTPAFDLRAEQWICFIQNHDQIANSAWGERSHALASPGLNRSMTAVMLLAPGTPMLFQGQEFAASSPFYYFADHTQELARLVADGRAKFLSQFPSLASAEMRSKLPDPGDPETFVRSKLDHTERRAHASAVALHKDLLTLRREDPCVSAQDETRIDGAVLARNAFVIRWFGAAGDDRLLLVNLGTDLHLTPAPEPLLAPPNRKPWRALWSSEDPRYGGTGTPETERHDGWHLPGHSALFCGPTDDD